jgi:hypothetical protein
MKISKAVCTRFGLALLAIIVSAAPSFALALVTNM